MIIDFFKKYIIAEDEGDQKQARKSKRNVSQDTVSENTDVKKAADFYRELQIDTLARTIYGEARGEPLDGMEAVASVVLNRVRIAEKRGTYWWGDTIISVCQKPYQFSCWNRSDPNYRELLKVNGRQPEFATCMKIATAAVEGRLPDETGGATHYHAQTVKPFWTDGETPCKRIGGHLFYRLVSA